MGEGRVPGPVCGGSDEWELACGPAGPGDSAGGSRAPGPVGDACYPVGFEPLPRSATPGPLGSGDRAARSSSGAGAGAGSLVASAEEKAVLRELQRQAERNQSDVYVLDARDLSELAVELRMEQQGLSREQAEQALAEQALEWGIDDFWQSIRDWAKLAAGKKSTFDDLLLLRKLATDLHRSGSVFTQYRVQHYNGKAYIIFKGYPGLRKYLTGTRYLASNSKLVSMGVGELGAVKAVKGGAIVTFVLSTAFYALEQLLDDEKTWHDFVGGISVDFTKTAIAGLAAYGAATLAGGAAAAGAIAIGPLLVAIAVGVGVGFALDKLDQRLGITDGVIAALRKAEQNVRSQLDEVQRQWNWYHRTPQSSVLFWQRVFGATW